MDRPVYGWVLYVEGFNDDYIIAWSAYERDLVADISVTHWQRVILAKEALEKLNYHEPTMSDLIECLF